MYLSIYSFTICIHVNWLIYECSRLVIATQPRSSEHKNAQKRNERVGFWKRKLAKCVNQHFPKVKKHQNIMNHRLKGMQIAHISSKNDHQLLSTTIFCHIFFTLHPSPPDLNAFRGVQSTKCRVFTFSQNQLIWGMKLWWRMWWDLNLALFTVYSMP